MSFNSKLDDNQDKYQLIYYIYINKQFYLKIETQLLYIKIIYTYEH